MTSYIAVNSVIPDAISITATEFTGDYDKEYAYDWEPGNQWRASGSGTEHYVIDLGANATIDTWGIAFHNVAEKSGTIRLQGSTDNFSSSINNVFGLYDPTEDIAFLDSTFSPFAYRYWRFKFIASGTSAQCGSLFLGEAVELPSEVPTPYSKPIFNRRSGIRADMQERAHFLGRTKYSNALQVTIEQKNVTEAWLDANWPDLIDGIEKHPFYYMWNAEDNPTEVVYCWTTGIQYPTYAANGLLSFTIHAEAFIE